MEQGKQPVVVGGDDTMDLDPVPSTEVKKVKRRRLSEQEDPKQNAEEPPFEPHKMTSVPNGTATAALSRGLDLTTGGSERRAQTLRGARDGVGRSPAPDQPAGMLNWIGEKNGGLENPDVGEVMAANAPVEREKDSGPEGGIASALGRRDAVTSTEGTATQPRKHGSSGQLRRNGVVGTDQSGSFSHLQGVRRTKTRNLDLSEEENDGEPPLMFSSKGGKERSEKKPSEKTSNGAGFRNPFERDRQTRRGLGVLQSLRGGVPEDGEPGRRRGSLSPVDVVKPESEDSRSLPGSDGFSLGLSRKGDRDDREGGKSEAKGPNWKGFEKPAVNFKEVSRVSDSKEESPRLTRPPSQKGRAASAKERWGRQTGGHSEIEPDAEGWRGRKLGWGEERRLGRVNGHGSASAAGGSNMHSQIEGAMKGLGKAAAGNGAGVEIQTSQREELGAGVTDGERGRIAIGVEAKDTSGICATAGGRGANASDEKTEGGSGGVEVTDIGRGAGKLYDGAVGMSGQLYATGGDTGRRQAGAEVEDTNGGANLPHAEAGGSRNDGEGSTGPLVTGVKAGAGETSQLVGGLKTSEGAVPEVGSRGGLGFQQENEGWRSRRVSASPDDEQGPTGVNTGDSINQAGAPDTSASGAANPEVGTEQTENGDAKRNEISERLEELGPGERRPEPLPSGAVNRGLRSERPNAWSQQLASRLPRRSLSGESPLPQEDFWRDSRSQGRGTDSQQTEGAPEGVGEPNELERGRSDLQEGASVLGESQVSDLGQLNKAEVRSLAEGSLVGLPGDRKGASKAEGEPTSVSSRGGGSEDADGPSQSGRGKRACSDSGGAFGWLSDAQKQEPRHPGRRPSRVPLSRELPPFFEEEDESPPLIRRSRQSRPHLGAEPASQNTRRGPQIGSIERDGLGGELSHQAAAGPELVEIPESPDGENGPLVSPRRRRSAMHLRVNLTTLDDLNPQQDPDANGGRLEGAANMRDERGLNGLDGPDRKQNAGLENGALRGRLGMVTTLARRQGSDLQEEPELVLGRGEEATTSGRLQGRRIRLQNRLSQRESDPSTRVGGSEIEEVHRERGSARISQRQRPLDIEISDVEEDGEEVEPAHRNREGRRVEFFRHAPQSQGPDVGDRLPGFGNLASRGPGIKVGPQREGGRLGFGGLSIEGPGARKVSVGQGGPPGFGGFATKGPGGRRVEGGVPGFGGLASEGPAERRVELDARNRRRFPVFATLQSEEIQGRPGEASAENANALGFGSSASEGSYREAPGFRGLMGERRSEEAGAPSRSGVLGFRGLGGMPAGETGNESLTRSGRLGGVLEDPSGQEAGDGGGLGSAARSKTIRRRGPAGGIREEVFLEEQEPGNLRRGTADTVQSRDERRGTVTVHPENDRGGSGTMLSGGGVDADADEDLPIAVAQGRRAKRRRSETRLKPSEVVDLDAMEEEEVLAQRAGRRRRREAQGGSLESLAGRLEVPAGESRGRASWRQQEDRGKQRGGSLGDLARGSEDAERRAQLEADERLARQLQMAEEMGVSDTITRVGIWRSVA
jgi:hypothetical protein